MKPTWIQRGTINPRHFLNIDGEYRGLVERTGKTWTWEAITEDEEVSGISATLEDAKREVEKEVTDTF